MNAEFWMQEARWRIEAFRREAEHDRLVRSCRVSRWSFKAMARRLVGRRVPAGRMPAPVVRPPFGTEERLTEDRPQARCA